MAKGQDQISDPQLADFAGNAFTSTVIAAIIMSLLSSLPKQKKQKEKEKVQADGPDSDGAASSDLDLVSSLLMG